MCNKMDRSEPPFKVLGDLRIDANGKDVSDLYRNNSSHGLKSDETIHLSWRVISTKTGRTICVFGGSAAYDAANVFCEYCIDNYSL